MPQAQRYFPHHPVAVICGADGWVAIANAVVTLDAMGCQTGITQQIVGQQAGYLPSLKGN